MMNRLRPYPSIDLCRSSDKAFADTLIEQALKALGSRQAFHLLKKVLRLNDPVKVYNAQAASRAGEPYAPFTPLPSLDNFRHKCETTCALGTPLSFDEIDVAFRLTRTRPR